MLVLTRRAEQSVVVGGSAGFERVLKVTVLEIKGSQGSPAGFSRRRVVTANPAIMGLDAGKERTETMTTEAQNVKYRRQLAKLEACRRAPDKFKMLPRERIRIKRRCQLCGRARAVYRKFGVCRICFRNLACDGLIPGVQKASW